MNLCDDNRTATIEAAKMALIKGTNIEDSPEEMKVLNSFMLRCWQMGWLDRYDPQKKQPITEDKIKAWLDMWEGYIDADMIARMKYRVIDIRNVQLSQAATDINVGHKAAGHGSNVPMQPSVPPMPSNTSNALDALTDAYKARSNALKNTKKRGTMSIEQEKMIVEALPSVYPMQKFEEKAINAIIDALPHWISCKKELPKLDSRCVLLYSDYTISGGYYRGNRTFEVDYGNEDVNTMVIAWMPRPEAWKG